MGSALLKLFRYWLHLLMQLPGFFPQWTPTVTHVQTSALCNLPEELLSNILSNLDIGDLLTCTHVCRLVSQLIKEDSRLQLTIELRRTSMIACTVPRVVPVDRLAALHDYVHRFQRSAIFSRHKVDFGSGHHTVWQRSTDGSICYVQRSPSDTVLFCVHEPGSGVRGIGAKTYSVAVDNIITTPLYKGTADVVQGLVVVSVSILGTWNT